LPYTKTPEFVHSENFLQVSISKVHKSWCFLRNFNFFRPENFNEYFQNRDHWIEHKILLFIRSKNKPYKSFFTIFGLRPKMVKNAQKPDPAVLLNGTINIKLHRIASNFFLFDSEMSEVAGNQKSRNSTSFQKKVTLEKPRKTAKNSKNTQKNPS
jgi:hypothetical protein